MTKEERDLLITDLCSRLKDGVIGRVYAECSTGQYDIYGDMTYVSTPFDVILDGINVSTGEIHVTAIGNEDTVNFIDEQQDAEPFIIEDFEPYLRPMSSMTVEETKYKLSTFFRVINTKIEGVGYRPTLNCVGAINYINWLNKNMFDYHGLIPMGLALEAKEDMYKSENFE